MTNKPLFWILASLLFVMISCDDEKENPAPDIEIPGLVASYSFDGNAEDAVGTNDGMVVSATLTTDRNGVADKAYYFDGVDDYVYCGVSATFDMVTDASTGLTILVWAKTNFDFSNNLGGLVTRWGNTPVADQFGLWLRTDGKSLVAINYSTNDGIATDEALDENWHQYAFSFDEVDGVHKVYVDGVLTLTSTHAFTAPDILSSVPLLIGAQTSSGTINRYFKGSIDEVQIYNKVLSASEVATLFAE